MSESDWETLFANVPELRQRLIAALNVAPAAEIAVAEHNTSSRSPAPDVYVLDEAGVLTVLGVIVEPCGNNAYVSLADGSRRQLVQPSYQQVDGLLFDLVKTLYANAVASQTNTPGGDLQLRAAENTHIRATPQAST